jgi:hypothetical protein
MALSLAGAAESLKATAILDWRVLGQLGDLGLVT